MTQLVAHKLHIRHFINVLIARFNSIGRELAREGQLVGRLNLFVTFVGLDLLEDTGVLLGDVTVVYQRLAGYGLSVRIRAQLFGSQVRNLDVTIICKCHDQTFTLLKLSTRHKHRRHLSLGRPNKPDILVNHEEVVKTSEHGHEAGSLQLDLVLNLCLQLLPRPLIVLIEIGPILR